MSGRAWSRRSGAAVVVVAAAIAAAGARDHAGSWNDGSRLATVESLVDRHTLAIDDSIFVRVPAEPTRAPYPPGSPLLRTGTLDKLLAGGRFYSDKPPVPALLMAATYQAVQWATGLDASTDPRPFCYWMTLASSGLAYVIAVWCVFALARAVGVEMGGQLLLAASLALSTIALPYTRHVNGHILLLAVAAALTLALVRAGAGRAGTAWIGTLAGAAYTIDLGAGPLLLACTAILVAYRQPDVRPLLRFAAAAAPWLALHHALNYAVASTWRPANTVPAYSAWPGSPFDAADLTGAARHETVGAFLRYAFDLLVGKRGFLLHDPTLLLALAGFIPILRRRPREAPELLHAAAWSAGTWLLYAVASTNHAGECVSIRWFVPLLAPGYLVLAVLLRDNPRTRTDLAVLSAWGAVLASLAWWGGPWTPLPGYLYWPLAVSAVASWAAVRRRGKSPP